MTKLCKNKEKCMQHTLYSHLSRCVSEKLIRPVLGEDYYVSGGAVDNYTCDEIIVNDLKYEFDSIKSNNKIYISMLLVSILINIILLLIILITYKT
jgi:hypothetical protein